MVEIYIDVAHLFLSAMDRWSGRHPCDIEVDKKMKPAIGVCD